MIKRIFVLVMPLAILIGLYFTKMIDLTAIDGNHFDIITVNSIFAGFLFSGLSLIVGLGASKTIKTLERTNAMDWIYFGMLVGIICSLLSIVCSMVILLFCALNANIEQFVKFFEIYFLFEAIVLFSLSINKLMMIIKYSRKEIKRELPNDKNLKDILDNIK